MAIRLSRRLETIASFVPAGCAAVDVGCDHAHIPIRLLQDGVISGAVGIDVAEGPLAIAATNLELAGLTDKCRLIRSDGLKGYDPDYVRGQGLAGCLIIAGMGGILMRQILEDDPDKTQSFETMVLSPHSEVWAVREYLMDSGYLITREALVEEDDKFYPVMLAEKAAQTKTVHASSAADGDGAKAFRPDWNRLGLMAENIADVNAGNVAAMLAEPHFQRRAELEFGPCLLAGYDKTLYRYIVKELRKSIGVYETLSKSAPASRNAAVRAGQVMEDIGVLQTILFMYQWLQPKVPDMAGEVRHAAE